VRARTAGKHAVRFWTRASCVADSSSLGHANLRAARGQSSLMTTSAHGGETSFSVAVAYAHLALNACYNARGNSGAPTRGV